MANTLEQKKVTGEVLVAYDGVIRAWVLEQIKSSGASINEERVQEMIDNALESFDGGLTEDDVKQVINEMVSNGELSADTQPQFEVISGKSFETVEQITSEFPIGTSSNVVLGDVTIGIPPNSETFQNVLANVTNGSDGTLTVITNDGRSLEFSYDTTGTPSNTNLVKESSSSTTELAESISEVSEGLSSVNSDLQNVTNSITTIQQTIINIQTNSLTETRVQEMIDASVGAAIADSY